MLVGLFAQVLLVHLALVTDEKRHDSRRTVVGGKGNQSETRNHVPIDDVLVFAAGRIRARGVVITPSLLQAEVLIRRGQSVTLTVHNEALDIKMSGNALMDGRANQRIKVENIGSGRVVEGLVRSAEQVEVPLN